MLNKDGVIIGKEWGGNGNLQVQGDVNVGGNLRINNRHQGWVNDSVLSSQATGSKIGPSFAGEQLWSHFPWNDQNTYIRPGKHDTNVIIGDVGNTVQIGRNDGAGHVNIKSNKLDIRRHIDATTDWGSKGNTLFAGWHSAKTVLGNYHSGAADYAINLPPHTVVSTNPLYVKDKICLNDVCLDVNELRTLKSKNGM
jgi:hypothetical protein